MWHWNSQNSLPWIRIIRILARRNSLLERVRGSGFCSNKIKDSPRGYCIKEGEKFRGLQGAQVKTEGTGASFRVSSSSGNRREEGKHALWRIFRHMSLNYSLSTIPIILLSENNRVRILSPLQTGQLSQNGVGFHRGVRNLSSRMWSTFIIYF